MTTPPKVFVLWFHKVDWCRRPRFQKGVGLWVENKYLLTRKIDFNEASVQQGVKLDSKK